MKRPTFNEMALLSFRWQREFGPEDVTDLLTHLAAHTPHTPIIFEARGSAGQVKYYIGVDRNFTRIITDVMKAHGDIHITEMPQGARMKVCVAQQLKVTKPRLVLNTERLDAVTRAGLAALTQPKNSEQSVLQIILGPPYKPSPMPSDIQDPYASWLQVALGNIQPASPEAKKAVREKLSTHGFNAVIRVGAAGNLAKAQGHVLSLLSALRTLESAGVSIKATRESPDKLDFAVIPWSFPMRLSVKEVANFLMLPTGEAEFRGVAGLHPKQLLPPAWYHNPFPVQDRTFAVSLNQKRLSISPKDSLENCHILGPIGSGKSTVMQRMVLSDIYAGRGVLVIDPKADLVNNILSRIPKHREDDVVIIDPSSDTPVGLNPLAHKNNHDSGLIADAILSTFQRLFAENWGIRSQDVISASLLTLVKAKGSSLLWLPTLLTNKPFREKITAEIDDKIGLEAFWTSFESMKGSEQRQEILPTLNKVRQFLLRPGLRNVLGQSNPKFDLMDLFTKKKIILVSLNKGLIGGESAKLLGSLIVGVTWTLALSRAGIPEEHRHPTSIYIDELQDYIASIATDFGDALAQARGLGIGFTVANQYLEQLPPEIRAGVAANCRNKICFGVSAADAKAMAAQAPELAPEDFLALPRYHIYTTINDNKRNIGWVSGQTLPMTKPICDPSALRRKVAARYGKPGSEVEREYLDLLASLPAEEQPEVDAGPVGRRKKA